jgi:hypothetical protein
MKLRGVSATTGEKPEDYQCEDALAPGILIDFRNSEKFRRFHVHLLDLISIFNIGGPSSPRWTKASGGPPEVM